MLDLHALSNTAGTSLTAVNTISGGDGASLAGVPIAPGAVLKGYVVECVLADTLKEITFKSADLKDPQNFEDIVLGASSALNSFATYTSLPFAQGARAFSVAQNTAGSAAIVGILDSYPGGPVIPTKSLGIAYRQVYQQTLTAIATAGSWVTTGFAPGTALPSGKWAILGVYAEATTNVGLMRFSHADFGGKKPGFWFRNFVTDLTASTPNGDYVFQTDGYQFLAMEDRIGEAVVPTFNATMAGSGLVIEVTAPTTDTIVAGLNLAKVG